MINHIAREPWFRHRSTDCNSANAALFHPVPGASALAAKAICADCPVIQQCAAWALADHGLEGVLGGMTAGERDRIRTR